MKFEEAQLYILFENQIKRKKYKQIAREIGIGVSTVSDIVNGKYSKANKKTLAKIEEWARYKKAYCANNTVKPRRLTLWQRFLLWLGV